MAKNKIKLYGILLAVTFACSAFANPVRDAVENIYTKEIINFVLEQINTKEMTKTEVMERYGIPKTTLYKWISKYRNLSNI